MVKDMKKIAEVVNTTVTEIEGSILIASINNWMTKCYEYSRNIRKTYDI